MFTPWRHTGRAQVQFHSCLTSVLNEGGQVTAPPPLPGGKVAWKSLNRKQGGPHSSSGYAGEKKNQLPLPQTEHQVIHSIVSSLYWLCYPASRIKIVLKFTSRQNSIIQMTTNMGSHYVLLVLINRNTDRNRLLNKSLLLAIMTKFCLGSLQCM